MDVKVGKTRIMMMQLTHNPTLCVPRRKKQELRDYITKYRPGIRAVPKARVLLVGSVGAGKSSFFNSINSIFRGNMTCQAIAGTADRSVTTQVSLLTPKYK